MSKITPKPISGFPEWLPEARLIELQWFDTARTIFESYGYCSIDPSLVEDINTITAKGEDSDKEIYGLRRLNSPPNENEPRLALHFDLTVPLARYVAQNYGRLAFPFKRYQMQRAWRGERPQEGRYREFYQCDIDVIDNNHVSLHFDSEMPRVVFNIFNEIGIDNVVMHINNRKIVEGFYLGLGISEPMQVIRVIDKLDKIGTDGVKSRLVQELGLSEKSALQCLAMTEIKSTDTSFAEAIRKLGVTHPLLNEGINELTKVMRDLRDLPHGSVCANLSIVRGLDYYTGTVYEGKLADYPDFPTIVGGGRYENLVSSYSDKKLPGIGISIGLTRIFGKFLKEGRLDIAKKCPTDVLVIRPPNVDPLIFQNKAEMLRKYGLNVQVYHDDDKVGNQIKYAVKRTIPYIFFAGSTSERSDEVKNLATGEQTAVILKDWAEVVKQLSNSPTTRLHLSRKKSVLPFNSHKFTGYSS